MAGTGTLDHSSSGRSTWLVAGRHRAVAATGFRRVLGSAALNRNWQNSPLAAGFRSQAWITVGCQWLPVSGSPGA